MQPSTPWLAVQSLAISCELGEKWVATVFLVELGKVVAAQRQLTWAAQLWGAAEALRDAFAVPIPLFERADYERTLSAAGTATAASIAGAAKSNPTTVAPRCANFRVSAPK